MLTQLLIKNFTIIEELNLDLQSGMTVLTGETGAGKSIIIDSLELALGARAGIKTVRKNCERCEITVIFDLQNILSARKWLKEHDLESNNECIIRRIIDADGRSRSTINGIPCPQQLVRELGVLLINIHGQHEHQNLLKADKQLEMLDCFAGHDNLCNKVKNLYLNWQKVNSELQEIQTLTNDRDAQTDLLHYQIDELDNLSLEENELENLHQEHKQLLHSEQILENCRTALELISQNNLSTAQSQLAGTLAIDKKINPAYELVNSAIIHAEEAEYELRHYLDSIDSNPEHLQTIEARLNKIHDLARKHRIKPEQLPDLHNELKEKLQQINNAQSNLIELQQKSAQLADEYLNAAKELSASRLEAAQKLAEKITKQMQQLNMPQGKFKVELSFINNNEFTANGLERAKFLVAVNPGHPFQPLNKTASGGELSRISLAIQVITATKDTTPTLIFDEVDAGIGGKTAQIVGYLLRSLGETAQVLCVTHLPQVAAQGHHHLQVSKNTTTDSTSAHIETLTGETRVQEIARMLGGIKITGQTLAHAKEMCEIV